MGSVRHQMHCAILANLNGVSCPSRMENGSPMDWI